MSKEQSNSIDIINIFTPEQKEQWQTIAPFFENGRKIILSTIRQGPNNPTEVSIDCLEEGSTGRIIKGIFEGDLSSLRTPEEMKKNRDNLLAIAQAIIANGSAQINVDLNRS